MTLINRLTPAGPAAAVEWRTTVAPVPYPAAMAEMEARVGAIIAAQAPELVWLLEHPALYTAGTSADPLELVEPGRLPVFETGRGGRYTYHGPGQRIAYAMLDLRTRRRDLRAYVHTLEEWIIRALADLGVRGERRADRIGIWVSRPAKGPGGREDKIAAVGVRVRHWVTFHGIAINVNPNLSDFAGIVPCGIREHGVTSLADLGVRATMADLDAALQANFGVFETLAQTE